MKCSGFDWVELCEERGGGGGTALAPRPAPSRPRLDERCVRKVGYAAPHRSVVDIHKQVVVTDIDRQLEALHQLTLPHQLVEEPPGQVSHLQ